MVTIEKPVDAEAYYAELAAQDMGALWRAPEHKGDPVVPEVAHVWHWRTTFPLLQQAAAVMGISPDAQRRVLGFRNPAKTGMGTTQTLNAALQMVLPGEVAPAHRHTMSALRFIIDAEGGYTVVNGEKLPMHNGDMILTPGWTWHDHKNENAAKPMVWMDLLDVPYVTALRAIFYEDYPGNTAQPVTQQTDASYQRFGGAGLLPLADRPRSLYSPLNVYRWQQTYEALKRIQSTGEGLDPFEGAIVEYVNPITGGHVLPTIACYLQVLGPGERTKARQQTVSKVYHVARGRGYTIINGQRFDWEQRDTFCVPSWAIHEHSADGEEAVLFSSTDLPILEPVGLYRERALAENGGHQIIKG